ncbi:MAG: AsmA family protein [Acidobacteriota bacterium]
MKNRRLLRFLGCAGGLFLVVVAVAALLLPRLADVNSHRPRLEEMASQKLGRPVHLGEMDLSVFPRPVVVVDGLRVDGETEAEPLVDCARLEVRAPLSALVSGEIELDAVELDQPVIRLTRNADGKLTLGELGAGGGGGGGQQGPSVALRRLSVTDGRVELTDESRPGSEVQVLDDLDLELRGLGGQQVERVRASGLWKSGGSARFDADLGLGDGQPLGTLNVEALPLASLPPELPAALRELGGELDLSLELAKAGSRQLELEHRLSGRDPVRLAVEVEGETLSNLTLPSWELSSGASTLRGSGQVVTEPARRVSLTLDESRLRASELVALVPDGTERLAALDGLVADEPFTLTGQVDWEGGRQGPDLVVEELALDGLTLTVERDAQGRFSFQGADDGASGSGQKKNQDDAESELRVGRVRLTNARVGLTDRSLATPQAITLTDLSVELADLSPGAESPLTLSARLGEGRIEMQGKVAPGGGGPLGLDLSGTLADLPLSTLRPYLEHHAGLAPKKGGLDWTGSLKGRASEDLRLEGRLGLTDLALPGVSEALDTSIEHRLRLRGGGERIDLERLAFALPGGRVAVTGRLDRPENGPVGFDLRSDGPARLGQRDLDLLLSLLGVSLPFRMELAEPLSLEGRLRRKGGELITDGQASLPALSIWHRVLEAPLQVTDTRVALEPGEKLRFEPLSLRVGNTDLSGRLGVTGLDAPSVDFDLRSQRADLDELFAFLRDDDAENSSGSAGSGSGGDVGAEERIQRAQARGRLRVDEAQVGGLKVESLDSRITLKDQKLTWSDLKARTHGGRTSGRAEVDLSVEPPRFAADARLTDVDVGGLLAATMGFSELSGTGSGRLDVRGLAGGVDAALRSVEGTAEVELGEGRLTGLDVLSMLERARVLGDDTLASLSTQLASEGTSFSRLSGRAELGSGTMTLRDLVAITPEARIDGEGTAGLVSQALDMDLRLLFSKEISRRMRADGGLAGRAFWDRKRSQVRVPLQVGGTFSEPKGSVDTEEALARLAKQEALDALLGRDRGAEESAEGSGDGSAGASESEDRGSTAEQVLGALLGGGRERPAEEPATPADAGSSSGNGGTAGAAPGRTDPPPAAGTRPDLKIEIQRVRWSGNFLKPKLQVETVVHGADAGRVSLVIVDPTGREVFRDDQAFASELEAARAGGQAGPFPLHYRLSSSKLGGATEVEARAIVHGRSGGTSAEARGSVEGRSLF